MQTRSACLEPLFPSNAHTRKMENPRIVTNANLEDKDHKSLTVRHGGVGGLITISLEKFPNFNG